MIRSIAYPRLVIAIDPGMSGAVALMGYGQLHVHRDFEDRRDISTAVVKCAKLCRWFGGMDAIVLEQVGARPGQGVCSMFSFGRAVGVAEGASQALFGQDEKGHGSMSRIAEWREKDGEAIPHRWTAQFVDVSPQKWQNWFRKELGIERPQEFDSRAIATKLLPAHAELFKRKKDHNTADAVLIGIWHLNTYDENSNRRSVELGIPLSPAKRKPRAKKRRGSGNKKARTS